ncbi:MAG: methionyl-tRNA formyltransferase [Chloroflexia bacterium]|nr:methionyl-tRNA formyltransferase [Chloroflexia bacterium]
MHKVVLFLLGQKGYQVLNAAICGGFKDQIRQVVVGEDQQIHEDFSDQIVSLCERHGMVHCERTVFHESLLACKDHVAFAAGWRWLIKNPFSQIVVFHDSLLPKYRGFNPLVTALLRKDSEVGVTAIIANKDFDRGDIVASKIAGVNYPVKIAEAIHLVSELYFDLAQSLFATLSETEILKGDPQIEDQASYSVWRDDEDYRIDWSQSADTIVHFINCLSFPYKGASSVCDGTMIRILDAIIDDDVEIANRDVGKVLFIRNEKPVVICGSGLLRIMEATDDEGRNVLPFKKFRSRLK